MDYRDLVLTAEVGMPGCRDAAWLSTRPGAFGGQLPLKLEPVLRFRLVDTVAHEQIVHEGCGVAVSFR